MTNYILNNFKNGKAFIYQKECINGEVFIGNRICIDTKGNKLFELQSIIDSSSEKQLDTYADVIQTLTKHV